MAAPVEKSFCVLEYHTSISVVSVQRAFRAKYAKDPPADKTFRVWHKQFTETGCLCKQKSSGRTLTAEAVKNIDALILTRVCGKNLNIVSMCSVSPVVHTSNTSSCQKKLFQFSCGCEQFH